MTDTLTYQPFYLYDTLSADTTSTSDTVGHLIDSVFQSYTGQEPLTHESLFGEHLLIPSHSDPLQRPASENPQWAFGIIIAALTILFIFLRVNRISLIDNIRCMFNFRSMNRMIRELNLGRTFTFFPIAVSTILTFSILFFRYLPSDIQASLPANVCLPDIHPYLIVLSATAILFFLRLLIIVLLGNAFEAPDATKSYILSNYYYHTLECVVAIPFILLTFYSPYIQNTFLQIYLIIIIPLMIIRIIRGLKLILTFSKSLNLHLFYYLCTLELLPIGVLINLLV